MNTVVNLWIAAPVLGTAVILQWTVLRTKYRNELTKQHARHVQQQQITSSHFEQAKRQIGQLQHDLAAARLQVKQLSMGRAAPPQSDSRVKEALNRMLDDAPASRRQLPADGFAETQPSPHSQHDIDLLLR
jgi:hypothetical protein